MCGIFGVWNRDGTPIDLSVVQRISSSLRHRGPDDEGYLFVNSRSGTVISCGGNDTDSRIGLPRFDEFDGRDFDLVLGHRRLAILDLSPAGHQPMSNPDGGCWIVHNGEIYNFIELRDELKRFGHTFRTQSDTEVILAAYLEWGEACVARFNGMWAFAIWDHRRGRLFCSRDHFGIKPFYLYQGKTDFIFASEVKAIHEFLGASVEPDWPIVADYLVYGLADHSRRTFFKNIQALPPAHSSEVDRSAVRPRPYWSMPPVRTMGRGVSDDEVARFGSLIRDAVRIRLRSDIPVGACLSGGLDSATIAVIVDEISRIDKEGGDAAFRTFSACYRDRRYDERGFIEELASQRAFLPTYVYPDTDQLASDIRTVVWHQDMPFQSTSIYAQYCVMKAAREAGTAVLLDGQGADEILAGYPSDFGAYSASLLRLGRWMRWTKEFGKYPTSPPFRHSAILSAAFLFMLPRWISGPWMKRPRKIPGFVTREVGRLADPYREIAGGPLGDPFATYLYSSIMGGGLQSLLRYEDRNSMAFSIETRLPFLDPRIVEFALNLPARAKIEDGWTKVILRRSMAGRLPESIRLRRIKMGFPTPEAAWLRPMARAILSSDSIRRWGILDQNGIDTLLRSFEESDAAEFSRKVWRSINVTLWLERFF